MFKFFLTIVALTNVCMNTCEWILGMKKMLKKFVFAFLLTIFPDENKDLLKNVCVCFVFCGVRSASEMGQKLPNLIHLKTSTVFLYLSFSMVLTSGVKRFEFLHLNFALRFSTFDFPKKKGKFLNET